MLAGQSLFVEGAPGIGKTYMCKGVVRFLRAHGKKVQVISKTHNASSRADGCTADQGVRRHVSYGAHSVDAL